MPRSPRSPTIEKLRRAQPQLAALGLAVDASESGPTPRLGASTRARIREFQDKYGIAKSGKIDAPTERMLELAARGATRPDDVALAAMAREFGEGPTGDAAFDALRARFALAHDPALAERILGGEVGTRPRRPRDVEAPLDVGLTVHAATRSPAVLGNGIVELMPYTSPRPLPEIKVPVDAILDWSPSPLASDTPFPENYYTYRHSLFYQADLNTLFAVAPLESDIVKRILTEHQLDPNDLFNSDPAMASFIALDTSITPTYDPYYGLKVIGFLWLDVISAWQYANSEFLRQRYASAVDAYNRCQKAALRYWATIRQAGFTGATLAEQTDSAYHWAANDVNPPRAREDMFAWRRSLLNLRQLKDFDWTPYTRTSLQYRMLEAYFRGEDRILPQFPRPLNFGDPDPAHAFAERSFAVPIWTLMFVLIPLARAEANRMRRSYADAIIDLERVLRDSITVGGETTALNIRCEAIETPFAHLLLAETLTEQAEAQYKARALIADIVDTSERAAALARVDVVAQDLRANGVIEGDPEPFQGLTAAATYVLLIQSMSDMGSVVENGAMARNAAVARALDGATSSVHSEALTLPASSGFAAAASSSPAHPHARMLSAAGGAAPGNPRAYAIILQANARLIQMWSGFNYLGYRDDYVPPWRFSFLVERARYFAEHAKNAQRDYLNFLSNAENDELQELSAAQAVELEKSNVRVEGARLAHAQAEAAAQSASVSLANQVEFNAQTQLQNYRTFDEEQETWAVIGSLNDIASSTISGAMAGGYVGAIVAGAASTVGAISTGAREESQRDLEERNLELAVVQATRAKAVAEAQAMVAMRAVAVVDMQQQAAYLRHEFALQTLRFLRSRMLNKEQWYRLASSIRNVADTYQRYAVELAFLAEQSYEFEADKRMDVIRFDYDQSDVGAMLAADFLLRDLDTLEQDLIVTQRMRQQTVRYVLSMASEFPQTLSDLTETGKATFSLSLEQLERRFPGLYKLRVARVDLQPVALMNPMRLSVELTHLGSGQVRFKSQPGSPLNTTDVPNADDWLERSENGWPIRVRTCEPSSNIYSGLTAQEGVLSVTTANQRAAFDGVPMCSSWGIDMSMRENQVVPGTLADVLLTFTVTGYHDPELRRVVDGARSGGTRLGVIRNVSMRSMLPDSFYNLVRRGSGVWPIDNRILAMSGSPDFLRNLGVMLPLVADGPNLGRACCRYEIEVDVTDTGAEVVSILPELSLNPDALTLHCEGPSGTNITWDFGDGTALQTGQSVDHNYRTPGRFEVIARLVKGHRLSEYRADVVISEAHAVIPPFVVTPTISGGAPGANGLTPVTVALPTGLDDVSIDCMAGGLRASGSASATLDLSPGRHTLTFVATRTFNVRLFSSQRYQPTTPVFLARGRSATNRHFARDVETSTTLNDFGRHIFGQPAATLSPNDNWTLQIPLDENPWFRGVTESDIEEFDARELADAILSLEFAIR